MAKFLVRFILCVFLLAVGGAAGFASAKLFGGNDDAMVITAYQDWHLVCPPAGQSDCHVDQDVSDARSGAVLARLSITGSGGARLITITLPHNLLIPPGIALTVGNAAAEVFPYDLCNRVGCIVPIRISANGEAKLRGVASGAITVIDADNKAVTIHFSLRGLGRALDVLDRTQSARTSWWRKILT